ncbi:Tripartite tricarboxylate transporter family receptor [compost metagenome]
MFMQRRKFVAACAAITLAACAGAAQAADYPQRPIQLVVPYPPGGAGDVLGRIIAKRLGVELKQSIIVENKAGAGTILGAQTVAKAAPDGYTLLLSSGTTFTVNPAVYAKLPYSPTQDFQPVGMVGRAALIIVANEQTPYSDVKGLVAAARKEGDKFSYGSFGIGTVSHFAGEMFQAEAGTHMTHIPYKGSGPAMTDLIGGQIPILFDTVVSAMPQIKSGKIKAIAVTTPQRSAFLPDVPTVAEAGYPNVSMDTWIAVFAPKRVPADVVATLNAALTKALQDPDTQKQLRASGFDPTPMDAASVARVIEEETPRFAEIAQRAGIKAQ